MQSYREMFEHARIDSYSKDIDMDVFNKITEEIEELLTGSLEEGIMSNFVKTAVGKKVDKFGKETVKTLRKLAGKSSYVAVQTILKLLSYSLIILGVLGISSGVGALLLYSVISTLIGTLLMIISMYISDKRLKLAKEATKTMNKLYQKVSEMEASPERDALLKELRATLKDINMNGMVGHSDIEAEFIYYFDDSYDLDSVNMYDIENGKYEALSLRKIGYADYLKIDEGLGDYGIVRFDLEIPIETKTLGKKFDTYEDWKKSFEVECLRIGIDVSEFQIKRDDANMLLTHI